MTQITHSLQKLLSCIVNLAILVSVLLLKNFVGRAREGKTSKVPSLEKKSKTNFN